MSVYTVNTVDGYGEITTDSYCDEKEIHWARRIQLPCVKRVKAESENDSLGVNNTHKERDRDSEKDRKLRRGSANKAENFSNEKYISRVDTKARTQNMHMKCYIQAFWDYCDEENWYRAGYL